MLLCVNQFILLLISNRKSFSNDYVCDYGNQSIDLLLGTTIIEGQVQDYELELKRMINIVEPLVRILFNNVRYTKKRTINERESPNDEARSNRHRSKHRILVLVGDVNNRQGYSASNVVGGYCCEKNDLLDDLLILYSVLVLTGVLLYIFSISLSTTTSTVSPTTAATPTTQTTTNKQGLEKEEKELITSNPAIKNMKKIFW